MTSPAGRPSRTTPELRVGTAVFDPRADMPGVIRSFAGSAAWLIRPSGHTWQATLVAIRPATERERLQLRALAALHRKQQGPAGKRR
ncbi:hypothetical protein ACIBJC_12970 [Streptomyces sp. NPDC050509]|uniref:hypothetical protein n=1 Tax=Streptomyces sp. NPDC050509 TaxID=3365620 RepID=UPI00379C9ABC